MGLRSHVDVALFLQSLPSLFIALVGVVLSGRKLDMEQTRAYAKTYPLLLLANCMLTFKGNVELIFALHLSSVSQRCGGRLSGVIRFAADNGCLVVAQSIVIGLSLGVLGAARNVAHGLADPTQVARLVLACLGACAVSSVVVVLLLVPSCLLAILMRLNPDNVILPVVSALSDLLDVACLAQSFEWAQGLSLKAAVGGALGLLALLPCLCLLTAHAAALVPLQPPKIVVLSYLLSAAASFFVQSLAPTQSLLAASTPIFCGLTGAIAYIHLNREISFLRDGGDKKASHVSLLAAATVVAAACAVAMPAVGIAARLPFCVLFVGGFVLSCCIMLRVVEVLVQWLRRDLRNAGVASVPIVTSVADFVGTLIVITTSVAVHGQQ